MDLCLASVISSSIPVLATTAVSEFAAYALYSVLLLISKAFWNEL